LKVVEHDQVERAAVFDIEIDPPAAACLGCGDNRRATLATWLLTEFDPD
jgi:hypothetical protein